MRRDTLNISAGCLFYDKFGKPMNFNKAFVLLTLLILTAIPAKPQQVKNLVIISTDGLRWQEVFKGLDRKIASAKKYNEGAEDELFKRFGAGTEEESRKKIFPFLWGEFSAGGRLYGNRTYGNQVNTKNPHWFSYPGYAELFNGFVDRKIRSNSYRENPNEHFLGFLNSQPAFAGKVAAFASWETFSNILNPLSSGIKLNVAYQPVGGNRLTERERMLNELMSDSMRPFGNGVSMDLFTHYKAMEYLDSQRPRVLYIAYGETDEWGHAGKYKSYIQSAHQLDKWLAELWRHLQSLPGYKDQTALILTTDHGRGEKLYWTSHGNSVKGANEIWFGIIAPGLTNPGEVKTKGKYHLQQLAQTACRLLGTEFKADHDIADAVNLK